MAIKIITDSTSYIPEEIARKLDISIVSLSVFFNGESHKEIDLDNREFYRHIEETGEIPKSSQPNIDELFNIFKKITDNGDEIVGIFISSKMSGTYSSAGLVKNMILENNKDAVIEIVDSCTNCMQMGFIAIEAARVAKSGSLIKDVVETAEQVRRNSRFLFVPDTLRYLQRGGRIGTASALIGGILQIKPILTVENGETTVFEKVRTKKKAVDEILNKVLNDCQKNKIKGVIVHHIDCQKEGSQLAEKLSQKLNIPVNIQSIGPVIGAHVGPGAIGVAYFTE
ncbi:DegV family protein [uncultured Clostridium sp.]|uniref:DegV family protein n=1 Tax=uncultured Clostridium sp. TaxID=59620 RepID=UPI0025FD0E10|nr:DegV family protein [uncultured Clostridium sp.]